MVARTENKYVNRHKFVSATLQLQDLTKSHKLIPLPISASYYRTEMFQNIAELKLQQVRTSTCHLVNIRFLEMSSEAWRVWFRTTCIKLLLPSLNLRDYTLFKKLIPDELSLNTNLKQKL